MSRTYDEVEFGEDLPEVQPDVGIENVRRFATAASMLAGRFVDHDEARQEGLPQAIVPGIMSQGILVSLIHAWAPGCTIHKIDTVFRAPLLVDSKPIARGVVTDKDDASRRVEIDLTVVNEAGETRVMGDRDGRALAAPRAWTAGAWGMRPGRGPLSQSAGSRADCRLPLATAMGDNEGEHPRTAGEVHAQLEAPSSRRHCRFAPRGPGLARGGPPVPVPALRRLRPQQPFRRLRTGL